MTVTRTRLDERRVVFDCPVCGVHHDGPLSIVVEGETGDWELPDGTTVGAYLRQMVGTTACPDRFITRSVTDEQRYDVTLLSYSDGSPTELRITPLAPVSNPQPGCGPASGGGTMMRRREAG